jgi:hypothetical protein
MTGNQDRTARATAVLEAYQARMEAVLNRAAEALEATDMKAGDGLGIQRCVKAAEMVAKAVRAVVFMDAPERPASKAEAAEDDMADYDDSPETMERLQLELQSRLDRLRTTVERKRLEGWTVVRTAARSDEDDSGSS